MYVCMYYVCVCMYVRTMYVCMYVLCVFVCTYVCTDVRIRGLVNKFPD